MIAGRTRCQGQGGQGWAKLRSLMNPGCRKDRGACRVAAPGRCPTVESKAGARGETTGNRLVNHER